MPGLSGLSNHRRERSVRAAVGGLSVIGSSRPWSMWAESGEMARILWAPIVERLTTGWGPCPTCPAGNSNLIQVKEFRGELRILMTFLRRPVPPTRPRTLQPRSHGPGLFFVPSGRVRDRRAECAPSRQLRLQRALHRLLLRGAGRAEPDDRLVLLVDARPCLGAVRREHHLDPARVAVVRLAGIEQLVGDACDRHMIDRAADIVAAR